MERGQGALELEEESRHHAYGCRALLCFNNSILCWILSEFARGDITEYAAFVGVILWTAIGAREALKTYW